MADGPPPVSKDVLTRKLGPLPTWGWMGVGLALVLAWRVYVSRKAGSAAATAPSKTITSGYQLPSNIPPQFTTVNEDSNFGNTTTINNNPAAPAPPVETPVPSPPAPAGKWVTVVQYRKGDERRHGIPSSPWGLAEEFYGDARAWPSIWLDPKNADLRAKRGDPNRLQGGDQVWVADAPDPTHRDTATRDSAGRIIAGSDGAGYTAPNSTPSAGRKITDRDYERAGQGRRREH